MQIIHEIARSLGNKFKFDIYAPEDIEQECFLLALPALEKYDGRAPLRNYLSVCLRRKVLNFKRDERSMSEAKHRVLDAVSLETEPASNALGVLAELENAEVKDRLSKSMPPDLRPDFLRLCDGYSLSHHRKKLILDTIRVLLKDYIDV